MKCPKCSTNLTKESIFCPKCGMKIEKGKIKVKEESQKIHLKKKWSYWITILFGILIILAILFIPTRNITGDYTEKVVKYKEVTEYQQETKLLTSDYNNREGLAHGGFDIPVTPGNYITLEIQADSQIEYILSDNIDDCEYASNQLRIPYELHYIDRSFGVSGFNAKKLGPINGNYICYYIHAVDPTIHSFLLKKLEIYEIRQIPIQKTEPYETTETNTITKKVNWIFGYEVS